MSLIVKTSKDAAPIRVPKDVEAQGGQAIAAYVAAQKGGAKKAPAKTETPSSGDDE